MNIQSEENNNVDDLPVFKGGTLFINVNDKEIISNEMQQRIKENPQIFKPYEREVTMNIPKIVRIGSMDYSVKMTDETIVLDRRECKGMIDYEFHEIKISNVAQDRQGQEQTFLHELLHGIVRERNLDLQNTDDEIIIDEIAVGLHQVIRDNPIILIEDENQVLSIMVNGEKIAETMARRTKNE